MAILTLRPFEDFDNEGFTATGAANLWDCINDSTTDDETTYISTTVAGGLYIPAFATTGLTTETINSVKVFFRARYTTSAPTILCALIKPVGAIQMSNVAGGAMTASYANYEVTDTIDYTTGLPFAIADLDACGLYIYSTEGATRVTQAYIEIDYTPLAPSTNAILFAGD